MVGVLSACRLLDGIYEFARVAVLFTWCLALYHGSEKSKSVALSFITSTFKRASQARENEESLGPQKQQLQDTKVHRREQLRV
jgi:hypothetical protein